MTDYAKVQTSLVYSSSSDYSNPSETVLVESELTPTQRFVQRISVSTSGVSPLISNFTTPLSQLIISNRDTTNYVTVAFTSNSGSASVSLRLPAGQLLALTDVKTSSSLTLTANTAACICDIIAVGS